MINRNYGMKNKTTPPAPAPPPALPRFFQSGTHVWSLPCHSNAREHDCNRQSLRYDAAAHHLLRTNGISLVERVKT